VDEPQLFPGEGPIDRALGFRDRLSFGHGLASEGLPFEREPPFPELSLNSLNDRVFDVSIFQLQSSSRSRRTASLSGFFDLSQVLPERR
jgi:hypothetical protein